MKFFIVGLHSSGKSDIVDILERKGISCGHIFSDITSPKDNIYNSYNYELYTTKDVNEVFENDAYIFVKELKNGDQKFYEGLSRYTFENNDVFVLSPDQLLAASFNNINEEICFIWIDNTRSNRYNKYLEDRKRYNFKDRELLESEDLSTFVKIIYTKPMLYFSNEDPSRIATILYTMVKFPETRQMFIDTYNS
jgi:hypothetical protein